MVPPKKCSQAGGKRKGGGEGHRGVDRRKHLDFFSQRQNKEGAYIFL
jgi:hypothetical protein